MATNLRNKRLTHQHKEKGIANLYRMIPPLNIAKI